ncbi:type II toxin-antitoxin system VapC family toxin [Candidatus Bathyarchaeota archaeon]|nr:type II toxin-antitoxin system VapC family toxin [Candidatus Bathyarchaeota archaeon]
MRLVVDASVVAKWFNIEELSNKAVEVKEAFVEGTLELAAPIHIIYEVGNSIWRNTQLREEDAGEAIASLIRIGLHLLAPDMERARRAMEIARLKKTTFYDATYLQAGEELKTPLLTADESQMAAGRGLVKTIHLSEVKL